MEDVKIMLFLIMICSGFQMCSSQDRDSTAAIKEQTEVLKDLNRSEVDAIHAQTDALDRLNRTIQERFPAR